MTADAGNILVSIIMPFYSHPEFVQQAIESALNQTHSHLEVLVVDDGSPHDLTSLTQPYLSDARFRVLRQENSGVAAARNTGIAAARGRYIQFLDSDDWLAPEKIARHVRALEERSDFGLVFCPTYFVEDGVVSRSVDMLENPRWRAEGDHFKSLWAANRMVVHAPLVRRTWLEQVGGFNTSDLTEDYELGVVLVR
jgi:glycosyltransferase involved in cell wall biosynthesis